MTIIYNCVISVCLAWDWHQHLAALLIKSGGEKHEAVLNAAEMGQKTVRPLPVSYTTMEDVSLPKDEIVHVPSLHNINSHPVPASRSQQQVLKDGYIVVQLCR